MTNRMEPSDLAYWGNLLYGEKWKPALARDMDVSTRTVRNWAKNGMPVKYCDILFFKLGERTQEMMGAFAGRIIKNE